ncbi:HRDC domain-containing protein [Deinococcus aquaedulcis]|uniref:HRDC domain-containing protein n=1 Tax=Deinococcus aquaedulcis TaxID=2840455 RepID=UPI001C83279B|nr:HRDC domain-containing protein [Deinococcus aquaedulcis]
MTDRPSPERPDARLVRLHAERGDPHARLAGALADLEGAGWGVLLEGPRALAAQLAAALGRGTLRVDPRIRLDRDALAGAGLAAASLDADWRGAQAVWLLEPTPEDLERARRAGVPVIVDATLAPGSEWFSRGAAHVTYRDSVTLSGHGDAPLCALFGTGEAPAPVGAPPSDLNVALVLRDVATLPLRLARMARTASALAERLGGAVQTAGPTALLLAPDAVADTAAPLGGVLLAARSVSGGVLLTPGLEDLGRALALLRVGGPAASRDERTPDRDPGRAASERSGESPERREFRGRRGGADRGRDVRRGERPGRFDGERPDRPLPDRAGADRPDREPPQRVTFDAPVPNLTLAPLPDGPAEEIWEPEIVFSDSPALPPAPLPIPVSGGPDAPEQPAGLPDVHHLSPEGDQWAQEEAPGEGQDETAGTTTETEAAQPADTAAEPQPAPQAAPVAEPAPVILPPDLPGGKEDPAAGLTDEQAAVYARLREWRNAEAKRQEISRFIIASNATLAEIARRVPYTEADLKAVRGMGPERLRKYGQKILEVVRG